MNYLTEIKAFYDLVQMKQLSTGQIALWNGLIYINNKCGWTEWFTVANLTLQLVTGLSRSGINKNRNILKQLGLIDFRTNSTKATSYKLITMSKSNQVSNQDSNQDSNQISNQDSNQISSTLNKLNKTKPNEVSIVNNSMTNLLGDSSITNITEAIMFLDELSVELIVEAIKRTGKKKKGWLYAKGILKNWKRAGYKTLEQIENLDSNGNNNIFEQIGKEEEIL